MLEIEPPLLEVVGGVSSNWTGLDPLELDPLELELEEGGGGGGGGGDGLDPLDGLELLDELELELDPLGGGGGGGGLLLLLLPLPEDDDDPAHWCTHHEYRHYNMRRCGSRHMHQQRP